MGSMGDSTRRRLESVVRGANTMAGGKGTSHGGYGGGMGGSFGKATRGLDAFGQPAVGSDRRLRTSRPASAGRTRGGGGGGTSGGLGFGDTHSNSGVYRERPKPHPTAGKAVWDTPPREMPRSTPSALPATRRRPLSARPSMDKLTDVKLEGRGVGMQGSGVGSRPQSARPHTGMRDRKSADGSGGGPAVPFTPPRTGRLSQSGAPEPAQQDPNNPGLITEAAITALEDKIRDSIREKRSVYEGSKEMLLRVFKEVDDGSGDVDLQEFCNVCEKVGVTCSIPEAQAIFQRLGYSNKMPFQKFATALLTQPSRQIAEDLPVRKGAFVAGQNANFNGKIIYKPCRTGVYTPSDWDASLADRSASLPNARLVLDFVYGYQGKDNIAQNLFFTSENKIVYFTAGVGVVYQRPPVHHMYFFLGHTDDICALTLCNAPIDFDGRSFPARTLVATGQVTSVEEGANICIWDSRGGISQGGGPVAIQELVRLKFKKEDAGFCALAFSPSGTRLVAVAMDNYHTTYVYDWRKQRLLSEGRGQAGDAPQVFGIEWNPYEITHNCPTAFVTFGKKHIKMWTASDGGATFTPKSMAFGRLAMQNITSAQWLPPKAGSTDAMVVAGAADGQLYIFKGSSAVKAITAHRPGESVIQSDGRNAHHGVRGMRAIKNGSVLLTGGADGTILQWDTSDGSIQDSRFAGPSIQLENPLGPGAPDRACIRALDYSVELDRVVVGTSCCDVIEVVPQGGQPNETLMDGHSGDVYAIAFHPSKANVFSTVSDSGHVHMWDSTSRQMTHCVATGWQPRAVAFSNGAIGGGGHHVAVGGSKGHIKILDESANLRPIHECKDGKEGVSDLMYSPNNRSLAVATFDTFVDVYNVEKGYQRIGRCSGHSATVRGVDWSVDSSIILSNSNDYELLHWNARTGKQITQPQRDVEFHTFTSIFGFPVMGIWPPFSTGTDINSLDRSKNQQWVATSDDHGMVKLFNYPCVVADAPHRAYRGHSSHVMGVRFNSDDTLVCSAGGHDWAVFQFKVVNVEAEPPPPPKKERVWGPLDPQGRTYGYTTDPVPLESSTPRKGEESEEPAITPPPSTPPPPTALSEAPADVNDSLAVPNASAARRLSSAGGASDSLAVPNLSAAPRLSSASVGDSLAVPNASAARSLSGAGDVSGSIAVPPPHQQPAEADLALGAVPVGSRPMSSAGSRPASRPTSASVHRPPSRPITPSAESAGAGALPRPASRPITPSRGLAGAEAAPHADTQEAQLSGLQLNDDSF